MKISKIILSLFTFIFAFVAAFATEMVELNNKSVVVTSGFEAGNCAEGAVPIDEGWDCSTTATNQTCKIDGHDAYSDQNGCMIQDPTKLLKRL